MDRKPYFAAPQDAEAAFYEAIEQADLEKLMAVWADDEEPVCVHPGGPRLIGFDQIRESWRRILTAGPRLTIAISHLHQNHGALMAVHSVFERVRPVGETRGYNLNAVTNVFIRGAFGWRMLVHHASPVPEVAAEAVDEGSKILH